MKTKSIKFLLIAALAFGVIWNILCLLGVSPMDKWPLSLGVVSMATLFILIPLAFPSVFRKGEGSNQTAEPEKNDWIFAGVMIVLLFAWVVTIIACLVHPL